MRLLLPLVALMLMPGTPARAHEGHDHGAPAASAASTGMVEGPPRASAQSPDFEAVVVLDGQTLRLYLDRYATNEPLADASVEIESAALNAAAARVAPGIYAASAPQLARPGRHALTLVVQAGGTSDLLSLSLDVPPGPVVAMPEGGGARRWLTWAGAAAATLLVGGGLRAAVRRRRSGATVGGAAAIVLGCAWTLWAPHGAAWAHGGEDHGHDHEKQAAAAAARPGAAVVADAVSARRLPDGSVFMPKAMQYQLGLRHQLARQGEHPATIEFSARVIADPNTSGRVQPMLPGRIEAGPQGLPTVGQRVAKGQLLAVLRPSTGAIERGKQQALRAELDAQRSIAERRVARLEQLEGAVPQKDIDAARIELDALRQRSAAIGSGLAATEPLLAPVAGVVSAVRVLAGQVVDARETVIEIVDPARLAVEALAYEPVLPQDLVSASVEVGGRDLPLAFVGAGRQLREQAMPLLFALRGTAAVLVVGQPLKVIARTRARTPGVALPRVAVVRLASGEMGVWVHAAAERFAPRRVIVRPLDGATLLVSSGVADGERIVTEGASLLAQVR